jgi:hypothetical protein
MTRYVESRFQRLLGGSKSWGDAPGYYEKAPLAPNRYLHAPAVRKHVAPGVPSKAMTMSEQINPIERQ